jgi:hypothetical protein
VAHFSIAAAAALPHQGSWPIKRECVADPGQVSDRADRLIKRLAMMEGNIALFSHGEFGPALAAMDRTASG